MQKYLLCTTIKHDVIIRIGYRLQNDINREKARLDATANLQRAMFERGTIISITV